MRKIEKYEKNGRKWQKVWSDPFTAWLEDCGPVETQEAAIPEPPKPRKKRTSKKKSSATTSQSES